MKGTKKAKPAKVEALSPKQPQTVKGGLNFTKIQY
jgi:hypothetical protein